MWDIATLQCPWCGERIDSAVDPGAASGDYVEDCPVCCRPIEMRLVMDEDGFALSGRRED